ncbi:MAG: zinc ABC transporter substrate-binding protein [Thermoguttaceae bacterium]
MAGAVRTTLFVVAVGWLASGLPGCGTSKTPDAADGRLSVFVGIGPLAYLVQQIGGPHVAVHVLVQPGQDPHTFEPTPRQVSALNHASLFFKVDMPFEAVLLEKSRQNNPRLSVVDATAGISKRPMDAACADSHDGHDHADVRGEPDPHVWLSPPLLKVLSQNVADGLTRADPSHRKDYEKNRASLVDRINALHRRVTKRLSPYRGRTFYVFHPGFGYFADAYGLKQTAVEISGKSPSPQQLGELIAQARKDRVRVVFAQPQSPPQGAEVVAHAIDGQVVFLNGLAENVLADIEDIAEKIENAMKSPKDANH